MRELRLLQKDATYHITSMINRGEIIFDEERLVNLFFEVIRRAKEKYDFEIKNFSIMPNHIHFLIKPLGKSNLSRIMQWILSVFAVIYNKEMGYSGHLWKGRFFSKIMIDIRQFLNTFRYISDNPVKAGLVSRANDYKFGGLYRIKLRWYDILSKPLLNM